MATDKLNVVVKKISAMPKGLYKEGKPQPDPENLDREFENLNKEHRNTMLHLDHLYERISHPFSILLISIVFFLVFVVFRYLEIFHSSAFFSQISNDAGKALTYIITIVTTSIFTKFFEGRKK